MFFTSDNSSPVHPDVMAALARANEGFAPPYGNDPITEQAIARVREVFEAPQAAVYFVATGSSANALSMACLCPPWATIYCHRNAHIEEDECGAPEFYTSGAKLTLLEGEHAKFTPETLERAIGFTARAGVHNVQKGAVSITNLTEAGTAYTSDEVRAISQVAKAHGLPLHMDGARFSNALAGLGCSAAELTWKAGVDVLSFGGTKNGLMGVEAVILFDPEKAWEFELRRKRGGHLFSKSRYLSAQMLAYLEDELWLRNARAANAAARNLADGLTEMGARLLHPVDGNQVFASWPRAGHKALKAANAQYYLWPMDQSLEGPEDAHLSSRMVASWNTGASEVDAVLQTLRNAM